MSVCCLSVCYTEEGKTMAFNTLDSLYYPSSLEIEIKTEQLQLIFRVEKKKMSPVQLLMAHNRQTLTLKKLSPKYYYYDCAFNMLFTITTT